MVVGCCLQSPPETSSTLPCIIGFVLELLSLRYGRDRGLLVLVDDAQWLDPFSLEVLAAMLVHNPNIAMVMAMRRADPRTSTSAANSFRSVPFGAGMRRTIPPPSKGMRLKTGGGRGTPSVSG